MALDTIFAPNRISAEEFNILALIAIALFVVWVGVRAHQCFGSLVELEGTLKQGQVG